MIHPFNGKKPDIAPGVFVAPNAQLIGDVEVGSGSSIWFGAVLRGDYNTVKIGSNTNIQDNAVLHITDAFSCTVGATVTVGHGAIIHGCTIGNEVLIGMGAIVLDGAVIEDQVIIGAGALVPPGKIIPKGHLAVGSPAKVVRPLSSEELEGLQKNAGHYSELAQQYLKGGCV